MTEGTTLVLFSEPSTRSRVNVWRFLKGGIGPANGGKDSDCCLNAERTLTSFRPFSVMLERAVWSKMLTDGSTSGPSLAND